MTNEGPVLRVPSAVCFESKPHLRHDLDERGPPGPQTAEKKVAEEPPSATSASEQNRSHATTAQPLIGKGLCGTDTDEQPLLHRFRSLLSVKSNQKDGDTNRQADGQTDRGKLF